MTRIRLWQLCGAGTDYAVYQGNFGEYNITASTTTSNAIEVEDTFANRDDLDVVTALGSDATEFLVFKDGIYDVGAETFDEGATIDQVKYETGSEVESTISEDSVSVISADQLLSNDTDSDGDTFSITNVAATDDTHGTVSLNSDGDVVFTPDENYNGPSSFEYTITDEHGATDTATVNMTVASDGLELAPTADIVDTSDTFGAQTVGTNTDDITADNTPTISGLTESNATVVIRDANNNEVGRGIADENGMYSITTSTLDEGTQDLNITATDGLGNSSSTIQSVTIDTSIDMDQLSITSIVEHQDLFNSITMTGTGAEVGSSITVYNASEEAVGITEVQDDGTWSIDIENQITSVLDNNEFYYDR